MDKQSGNEAKDEVSLKTTVIKDIALAEAEVKESPKRLRYLFAILLTCTVPNPFHFWKNIKWPQREDNIRSLENIIRMTSV